MHFCLQFINGNVLRLKKKSTYMSEIVCMQKKERNGDLDACKKYN